MRGSLIIAIAAIAASCSETKPAEPVAPQPLPNQNAVRCQQMLAEIRALRDGPQPCAGPDDCTVWHNGEHWDGCPVEVNKENGAILDKLRRDFEALGCPVDKGASCAAQEVKFCVAGGCGGKVAPKGAH
jgi:hypothetical protein